jgi:hypothetical protein
VTTIFGNYIDEVTFWEFLFYSHKIALQKKKKYVKVMMRYDLITTNNMYTIFELFSHWEKNGNDLKGLIGLFLNGHTM